jgi:hypothetical protein
LHLPPYYPELNPVENIWQYLRQNDLSHMVFDAYTDVVDACCHAWNAMCQSPEIIRSVATRSWAAVIAWGRWYYWAIAQTHSG